MERENASQSCSFLFYPDRSPVILYEEIHLYQRPKDWSVKEKVFIFVPDCTEAYIVVRKTVVIVLLPPRCVAVKQAGGWGLFKKPYIFKKLYSR